MNFSCFSSFFKIFFFFFLPFHLLSFCQRTSFIVVLIVVSTVEGNRAIVGEVVLLKRGCCFMRFLFAHILMCSPFRKR